MAVNGSLLNENLLDALFNPQSNHHGQGLQKLQEIWDSPDGYKICISTFINYYSQSDEKVRFLCLHAFELWIKKYYQNYPLNQIGSVRQTICELMQTICSQKPPEKPYIRNKVSQLLALIFVSDYEHRWPDYFDNLISLLTNGAQAVDLYVKILKAIDSEVVDRECLHTPEQIQSANHLKDLMRERAMVKNAAAWYDILEKYGSSNPEIVCECHEVIGSYASWIDIHLVANNRFILLFSKHMTDPLLRESAAECLLKIISKGMEPCKKFEVIETIWSELKLARILCSDEDDESDFIVKLAKLVNGIGTQLILSYNKMASGGQNKPPEEMKRAIEDKTMHMLGFLASEYDDVSGAVFDYARQYIHFIQRQGSLSEMNKGILQNMLSVLINKSKFDESYNFDHMGEDEAMFNEYRKSLKVVFDNLASFIPDLTLVVSNDYVMTKLNRWQAITWQEIECAITLLYNLGEAIPANVGSFFNSSLDSRNKAYLDMVRLLTTCGVSNHTHTAVALSFFDCILRYEKFFIVEPQHLPAVLSAFFDHRGLRSPSPRIRGRVSNFLMRFIRSLKHQMLPFFSDIMSQLQPLLVIQTNRLSNTGPPLITPDDQQCVYECCAHLLVAGKDKFTSPSSADLLSQLLNPVLETVGTMVQRLSQERDPSVQECVASILFQCSALVARVTKGFTAQVTMKTVGCVELFVHATNLFINCINSNVYHETINKGVRQLTHRLIVCLESDAILPLMGPVSEGLLRTTSIHTLSEYMPIINQLMSKHQSKVQGFVTSVLAPLVNAIFNVVNDPALVEDEDMREKKLLQRNYYTFLLTLLSSKLIGALLEQQGPCIEQVIMSVIHGAVEMTDPPTQKTCYTILKKLVENLAQGDGTFVPFIYAQIVPACFLGPMKPTFDLRDFQTVQALNESGACIKEIYRYRGDEFTTFLRTDYFVKMSLESVVVDEYCHALSCDIKFYREYLKHFFGRLK